MDLKYFKKGNTQNGYGEAGFCLGNIFSLREENSVVILMEECDGYHRKDMSPEAAVEMFEEAIKIIKHAA